MNVRSIMSAAGLNVASAPKRVSVSQVESETPKSAASPADELALSVDSRQSRSGVGQGISELTPEQEEQVEELRARDREVRAHEQAHLAAAGPYALGGPTYDFQSGPDGRQYAVGGEVQIDTAPVEGDPEATIRKAQIIRAAALAPAEPSSQDRAVAAAASQLQSQAQAELLSERQRKSNGERPDENASVSERFDSVLLGLVTEQSFASLTPQFDASF